MIIMKTSVSKEKTSLSKPESRARLWYLWDVREMTEKYSGIFLKNKKKYAYLAEQYMVDQRNRLKLCKLMRYESQVQVGITENNVYIVTDYYGIEPLYIYTDANTILIFTHHYDMHELIPGANLTPDHVGIWETFLFDGCIGNRTLQREIKILPPGHVIAVDKTTIEVKYKSYYNYDAESVSCNSVEDAVTGYIDLLRQSISKISEDSIVLPLSAGYDSRLLAILLAEQKKRDKIHTITYACHKSSYELKYAKRICRHIGLKESTFFQLDSGCYLRSLELLPERTGGNLSISHGHLFNLVNSLAVNRSKSSILVSGVFGEIAGTFATGLETVSSDLMKTKIVDRLNSFKELIGILLYEEILNDIYNVYRQWESGSGFQTFDEYKYFNQRVPKVLLVLNAVCGEKIKVEMPNINPDIVEYMLGLPKTVYLSDRKLTRLAIQRLEPKLYELPVLSANKDTSKLHHRLHVIRGKIYNNMAKYATVITGDIHLFFSPYETECQDYLLRTAHRKLALDSLRILNDFQVVNEEQRDVLSAKPIKQRGGWFLPCTQYWAITIAKELKKYN